MASLGSREVGPPLACPVQREQREELTDVVSGLRRMAHLDAAIDHVAAPPAHPLALQEPGFDEVGDDPLDRTLGDPDHLRHVAEPYVRITRDAEQHLRVVRDEAPALSVLT